MHFYKAVNPNNVKKGFYLERVVNVPTCTTQAHVIVSYRTKPVVTKCSMTFLTVLELKL